jgi:hypothetical protein
MVKTWGPCRVSSRFELNPSRVAACQCEHTVVVARDKHLVLRNIKRLRKMEANHVQRTNGILVYLCLADLTVDDQIMLYAIGSAAPYRYTAPHLGFNHVVGGKHTTIQRVGVGTGQVLVLELQHSDTDSFIRVRIVTAKRDCLEGFKADSRIRRIPGNATALGWLRKIIF